MAAASWCCLRLPAPGPCRPVEAGDPPPPHFDVWTSSGPLFLTAVHPLEGTGHHLVFPFDSLPQLRQFCSSDELRTSSRLAHDLLSAPRPEFAIATSRFGLPLPPFPPCGELRYLVLFFHLLRPRLINLASPGIQDHTFTGKYHWNNATEAPLHRLAIALTAR
jgi:hypothetical protein